MIKELFLWLLAFGCLTAICAVALELLDPRWYVMPRGGLPDGLPLLGTEPGERLRNGAILGGAMAAALLTLFALVRLALRQLHAYANSGEDCD